MRRFQVHNSVYLEIMDEYDKQYPMGVGSDGIYDDMYYYDQLNGGMDGYEA